MFQRIFDQTYEIIGELYLRVEKLYTTSKHEPNHSVDNERIVRRIISIYDKSVMYHEIKSSEWFVISQVTIFQKSIGRYLIGLELLILVLDTVEDSRDDWSDSKKIGTFKKKNSVA